MEKKNNVNPTIKKHGLFVSDFIKNKELYTMAIPIILFYLMFCYMPMYGAIIAFKNYTPAAGIMGSQWVGLQYFEQFFSSPYFSNTIVNTLRISISTIIFSFPMPIVLALLLNEVKNSTYKKVVQTVSYMPHFISLVVICSMIKTFTMDSGIINSFLSLFGFEKTSLLLHAKYFVPIYVISGIWQELGWSSIIYLAALSGVDQGLYEAAKIDGANRWKQTIHVTLPSIVPTIITMFILKVGSVLGIGHEKLLLLSNDYTASVAEVISTYVYKRGLINQDWSFSTAVGLFSSVVNFIILIITNKISRKVADIGLW